ncbi:MAG: nucleotidyltransferase domain-containing protein [Bacteroidales bacterium]
MDKVTIEEIVRHLKTQLENQGLKLQGIAVFGSRLQGNDKPDSDVDLIIISDEFEKADIFRRGELTMTAEINTLKKFMVPLDILKMTSQEYQAGIDGRRFKARVVE